MVRPIGSVSCLKSIPDEVQEGGEEMYGPHSRCFEWRKTGQTDLIPQCHLGKCEDGVIKVKFKNGKQLTCFFEGQVIKLDSTYELVCPSPQDFCTDWTNRCPLDCNSNGLCLLNNTCHCFSGYSGEDCVSLNLKNAFF